MTNVFKIFGPPGTGKTTKLLSLMEAELAAGVEPEQLAYLTFTVAARREAKTRARTRFGFSDARLRWFRTLHSVAYELLGVGRGVMITSGEGLEEFGEMAGYGFSAPFQFSDEGLPAFGFNKGDKLLSFDHFRRHRLLSIDAAYRVWPEEIGRWEVQRFTDAYMGWKTEMGKLDFTDLLERGAATLPCKVVIVDEAQDLSPLQWRAFWTFAQNAERVYIAGDDDQAIYEWAGASPAAFLAQPGHVEVLPQSYRCPVRVADIAKKLISSVHQRQEKMWLPRPEQGTVRYAALLDQLDVPETGRALYLYRNHKYAVTVTDYLRTNGLVFTQHGRSSVSEKTASAIIVWERLRKRAEVAPEDVEDVFELASLKSIGAQARAEMRRNGSAKGLPLERPWYDVLDKIREDLFYLRKIIARAGGAASALTAEPRITISTIHAAKGAEAEHVILLTDMSSLVQKSAQVDPDAERRVWYVGITRAKETLSMVGFSNSLL